MINEAELRQMTPGERRQLARKISEMDYPHPLLDMKLDRRRRMAAAFFAFSCAVLVAWIVVLIMTLRREYTATHWRLAWVGFDFVLLGAFAATGWAFWRGRQIVIAGLMITATLLCCDAWFDVILDLRTDDMWLSIASAVFVELPLAFLMLNAARRLIRMSALAAVGAGGNRLPLPSLWKLPLASVVGPVVDQAREQMERFRPEHDQPEHDQPEEERSEQDCAASGNHERQLPFGHGHRLHRGNRGRRRHR